MRPLRTPVAFGSGGLLFAEDFDALPETAGHAEPESEPEVIEPVFTATELAEARAAAWAEGHAAGLAEARGAAAAQVASALRAIRDSIGEARAEAARIAEREAAAIAKMLAYMLLAALPSLWERHAEEDQCALARLLIPPLRREPVVTVRLNLRVAAAVRDEIIRAEPDMVDRVRLVGVPEMPAGDLRVSWEDGMATRDTRALRDEIEAVLRDSGVLIGANHTEGDDDGR